MPPRHHGPTSWTRTIAAVDADRQVDEGESLVLRAAIDSWGLHPDEQELLEPLLYGLDFQVVRRGRQWL